ncbi:MAG: LacI family transcriptional regulator [Spartobacteria bacterium]|nr:LacI family transcriptional regulator [Spartobacteria bacterium]
MPPTLEDVGRKCGVSRSTVSRVINKSPLVNPETQEKVLKTIEEMGYAPNFIARSLTTNRTETIAVTLPDIAGGVFPEILAGMDEVASRRGYHILVVFVGGARPDRQTVEELVTHRRVDAVLTVATIADDQIEKLIKFDVPLIRVAQSAAHEGVASVSFDNRGGARDAVNLLIRRGCANLLHITGPLGNYDALERQAGFREALQEAGLSVESTREYPGTFMRESGAEAVQSALANGVKFDGIFAANDEMAIGAMEVLCEKGMKIPDDVCVIGFDDIDTAHFIGLSTVRVPMREIGRKAAQAAFRAIDHRDDPLESVELPTSVVERTSTMRGETDFPLMLRVNGACLRPGAE